MSYKFIITIHFVIMMYCINHFTIPRLKYYVVVWSIISKLCRDLSMIELHYRHTLQGNSDWRKSEVYILIVNMNDAVTIAKKQ